MTLFLFPNDYDATTAVRRVLSAGQEIFPEIKFLYWARNGKVATSDEEILYRNIEKESFDQSAPPRSVRIFGMTLLFQFWLLARIKQNKPKYIVAFYFYTILPALIYKYFFDRKCTIVYDPRDYFAVCFKINRLLSWTLKLIDNIFISLSDHVIFPDYQYFRHYGMFRLKKSKYFIVPNSTEETTEPFPPADIRTELGIPSDTIIIPIIGYFSDARGKAMIFSAIELNIPGVHFVVAGNMRDQRDVDFFNNQSNVTYLGKIPYPKALWLMRNSAFVPLFYDPSLKNHTYAIPTKFYDSLMVGTPVVLSSQLVDAVNLSRRYKLGLDLAYNDLHAFVEIIYSFRDKQVSFNESGLRDLYLRQFDFSIFKDKLKSFYAGIVGHPEKELTLLPLAS